MNIRAFNKDKSIELFVDSDGRGEITMSDGMESMSLVLGDISESSINKIITVLKDFVDDQVEEG